MDRHLLLLLLVALVWIGWGCNLWIQAETIQQADKAGVWHQEPVHVGDVLGFIGWIAATPAAAVLLSIVLW